MADENESTLRQIERYKNNEISQVKEEVRIMAEETLKNKIEGVDRALNPDKIIGVFGSCAAEILSKTRGDLRIATIRTCFEETRIQTLVDGRSQGAPLYLEKGTYHIVTMAVRTGDLPGQLPPVKTGGL